MYVGHHGRACGEVGLFGSNTGQRAGPYFPIGLWAAFFPLRAIAAGTMAYRSTAAKVRQLSCRLANRLASLCPSWTLPPGNCRSALIADHSTTVLRRVRQAAGRRNSWADTSGDVLRESVCLRNSTRRHDCPARGPSSLAIGGDHLHHNRRVVGRESVRQENRIYGACAPGATASARRAECLKRRRRGPPYREESRTWRLSRRRSFSGRVRLVGILFGGDLLDGVRSSPRSHPHDRVQATVR